MNCLAHIQKQLTNIVLYSGRGPMQIGPYSNCLQIDGMDYKLIRFYFNQDPSSILFQGLCLPEACTGPQLTIAINQIIKSAKIPIALVEIRENIPSQTFDFTWGFFAFFFIMTLLSVLILTSSFSKTVGSHPTLSVFSLQNSMKIFQYKDNNLNVLNGVKSLSMLWVIFGHEYILTFYSISNIMTIQLQTNKMFYLLVGAALWAVDVFFFVGGFLVAYAVLKEKSVGAIKYPLSILNRYLRFIPSYFIAILIDSAVMIHLSSGPLWADNIIDTENCKRLWKTLLFVDNFVDNGESMCMEWGWYLQIDMQIFIYCILILLVYKYSKNSSYLLIFLSIAASWAFNMQQTYDHHYHNISHLTDYENAEEYQLNIYFKPWARCAPYLYGLLFGLFYVQYTNKEEGNLLAKLEQIFKRKVWVRRSFQLLGVAIGVFLICIARTAQGDNYWSQLSHSLYLTYPKTLFVVAVSFIILPSMLGINTLVKFLLDTKFFNFIAKISFWTYLIHLIVMNIWITSMNTNFYLESVSMYCLFASHTLMSMFLAFILTVVIEIPCIKIQKKLIHWLLKSSNTKKLNTQSKQSLNVTLNNK